MQKIVLSFLNNFHFQFPTFRQVCGFSMIFNLFISEPLLQNVMKNDKKAEEEESHGEADSSTDHDDDSGSPVS